MIRRFAAVCFALGLACLVAIPAFAEDIWEVNNHGGGKIVLTSDSCTVDGITYKNFFAARTWNNSGERAIGCWTIPDDKAGFVRIIWAIDPPLVKDYPVSWFTRVGKEKPQDDRKRI